MWLRRKPCCTGECTSAGVSAWRFIFPAAAAAALLGVLTVAVFSPAASALADQAQRMQARMLQDYLGEESKAIWLRQGDGQTQIIIRAARQEGPGVRFKDVTLLVYRKEADGSLRFTRRIDADEARLQNGRFALNGVRAGTPGALGVRFGQVSLPSTINMTAALERFASPQAVPFWALPLTIVRTERAGFSATAYRLQAGTFGAIAMALTSSPHGKLWLDATDLRRALELAAR